MDIAAPTPEPGPQTVRRDRVRAGYALLGAAGLVLGIWVAWFGAWTLGWHMDDLGIRPRHASGLIGVLTAPFAHASFEHLMSNTLPLGMLAALTLYAYPRAARYALPLIWIASGLGVWLWARPSVHVGISGIVHGLMFFLFVMGLLRRDRLGVAIALLVFFLYGGMVMTVLPRDPDVSFEYHLFGALAGIAAALVLFRLMPCRRASATAGRMRKTNRLRSTTSSNHRLRKTCRCCGMALSAKPAATTWSIFHTVAAGEPCTDRLPRNAGARIGASPHACIAMNSTPRRVEHQQTDKGSVPVYTTTVVEQPWASYAREDHATWATLFKRQQEILLHRACREFIDNQRQFGMTPDAIPKFDDLNRVLKKATGWVLIGVEGLLPELTFFDHLANRRFPVTWWIRKPEQIDYIAEPDLFHDLFGHVPLLLNPVFADYMQAYGQGRRQGARHRRRGAGQPHAPVLVHGRIRLDPRA